MTEKRCTDCKYTKGIGYDFWCGEGHTEYEVFGAETNCPYYEYHDWSKGTPSRTGKRFYVDKSGDFKDTKTGNIIVDFGYSFNGMDCKRILDLLNQLNDENEKLNQQLQKIQDSFEVNITQNYEEFDKDKLYIKDNNTKLCLNGTNLFIEVYIPQTKEYYRFKYIVAGCGLMREFIENYNSKEDME